MGGRRVKLADYQALEAAPAKKRRRVTLRPEEILQREVVDHLRRRGRGFLFFAVPNQRGTRSRAEMGVLWAMGVRAGVADLVFVLAGGRVRFIELKAPKNFEQSDDQVQFEVDMLLLDAPYLICRSLAEVEGALAAWGVPLRGTVTA